MVKIDKTMGHAAWTFGISGPSQVSDVIVAGGNPNAGESTTISGLSLDPGKYFVSEKLAGPANCFGDANSLAAYWTQQTSGSAGVALTTPGQVAVFTFVNTPCPLIPYVTPTVTATPTAPPSRRQRPALLA